jgi:hypothetical protein
MNAITSAVIKQKSGPRTAESLEAEVDELEHSLGEAQRAQNAARTALPGLIAAGDPEALAQCRKREQAASARIADVSARLEQTSEALKLAQGRDRTAVQARTYKEIKQFALAKTHALLALAESIESFGRNFNAVRSGLEALAAQTTRIGVPPDQYEHPHLMHRRLVELVEYAIFLDTGGAIGKTRTLNGPEQLAKGVTGSSVIQDTSSEFLKLTMRRVQVAMHLDREPE